MNLQLNDKTALVTGGAKGIGESICRTLAAEGARVCILDKDAETAAKVVGELPGGTHIQVDLTDLTAVAEAAKQATY